MSGLTPIQSNGQSDLQEKTCDRHGVYMAKHLFGRIMSSCPTCQDESMKAKMIEAQEHAQRCRENAISMILGRSGIPPRFKNHSFDNYKPADEKQARVLKVCKAYAERFDDRLAHGGGLAMCGSPGTGKTHLACAIANQIAQKGRTSLFTSVMAAIRRVKSTYSKGSEENEQDAIHSFLRPDLLILDEVGVQFGSDTEKMILFEIINGRYENMLPTILISNLTAQELGAFIGERILDRMTEGGGVVLAFDWDSKRADAKPEPVEVRDVDWERLHDGLLYEGMNR